MNTRPPHRCSTTRLIAILAALGLIAGAYMPSLASAQIASAHQSLKDRFEAGRSAHQSDRHETAIQLLRDVVEQHPTFRTSRKGAAAYWLGAAYAAQGDSTQAHNTWRMGMYALANEGKIDPFLVDAYVRGTFQQHISTEYVPASRAYLYLLRHADRSKASQKEKHLLRRHVAQMVFLLPDSLRAVATDDVDAFQEGEAPLNPHAGSRLAGWWKRQDPRPATRVNERLIEHLMRVAEAEQYFGNESLRRFDDRGQIYVRLGTPHERRTLTSTSLARSVSSQSAFIPRNEYWRYAGFGRHSHYLFVKRGGSYTLAGVTDLLPSSMRHNMRGSGALAALALYDYYNALVPRVPEYYPLFDKVDDTVAQLKHVANMRMTTVGRLADSNFDPTSGEARLPSLEQPFFHEAKRVDREVAQIREREVPTVRSEVTGTTPNLAVDVRTARFLRDDGSTRTEVYWSIADDALRSVPAAKTEALRAGRLPSAQRMLRLSTIRYGDDYQNREERQMHLKLSPSDDPAAAHVFGLILPNTSRQHHLALQWDQYIASEGAAPTDSTHWTHASRGLHWTDSLHTLSSNPSQLVLSDLVPLHAEGLSQVERVRTDTSFQLTPYTADTLGTDTKLAFYVEAYHLTFGANDQTHYTVAYEVQRREQRSGLDKLMKRSAGETITTAATSYTGASRTASEYVLLNPSQGATSGVLQVTVRITDEVSGQQAERSLSFELRK